MNQFIISTVFISFLTLTLSIPTFDDIDLLTFNSSQGVFLTGGPYGYWIGRSVSTAGDLNNDGVDDIIIGTGYHSTYVVYGKKEGPQNISLDSLEPDQGFTINGSGLFLGLYGVGYSVSAAGDINNDGIDDIVLGFPGSISNGSAYVIFGNTDGYPNGINLDNFSEYQDQNQGFEIMGESGDLLGLSVSGKGDVNGDNISDIIIGSNYDTNGRFGRFYVIYGSDSNFSSINVSALNNTQGFTIYNNNTDDNLTNYGSIIEDINGDGINDILISSVNSAFVIFGNKERLTDVDVSNLQTNGGFKITCWASSIPPTLSGAGDINDDGVHDFLVTAPPFNTLAVIYGKKQGGFSDIDIRALSITDGFLIFDSDYNDANDYFGYSISSTGDINKDGIDDFIIMTPFYSPNGRRQAGIAYVIYGNRNQTTNIDVSQLNNTQGFRIIGANSQDNLGYASPLIGTTVSNAGDINGDGLQDLIIGTTPPNSNWVGFVYVIYGKCPNESTLSGAVCSSAGSLFLFFAYNFFRLSFWLCNMSR